MTQFEIRVYEAVRAVPAGRVTTYKLVAEHLGCRSCRAVGQALRRNPLAPEVPCHRVIASDMGLGGFRGQRSGPALARKRRMLASEGVRFLRSGLVDPRCLYTFCGG